MSNAYKRMMAAAVLVLVVLAVGRAANYRYQETERAFRQACSAELKKLGAAGDLRTKYPTPVVTAVSSGCLLPGGTAEVVVRGKFVPGTKFIFQNDNFQVVKESLAGGEYRATVKATPGVGPQTADLQVISPVTCTGAFQHRAVAIGGRYEWKMEAANGWRIEARPAAGGTCGAQLAGGQQIRPGKYDLLFYRAGENAPFEKREATLDFSLWNRANYAFSVKDAEIGPSSSHEALMKKLQDPNLPMEERQRLMQDFMKMQGELIAAAQKMSDPAYRKAQEAKKLEFGCGFIDLELPAGSTSFKGTMRCSEKVGRQIAVTGSMKSLGQ